MPRDVTVTFQDGTSAVYRGVPDAATPDEVLARVTADSPGKQVTELDGGKSPRPGVLGRTGASLMSGLGKSVGGVLAVKELTTPPDLRDEASGSGLNPWTKDLKDSILKFWENVGTKYGLENPYVKSAVESIGGGLAFGGVGPAAVVSAGTAGLGSEAAAQLLGDNLLTRTAGGLLGGLAGAAGIHKLSSVRPQTGAIAREAIEGITDDQLRAAQEFQRRASAQGMDVDLAQALHAVGAPAANITTLRNALAQRKEGNKVQELLARQPGELSVVADTFTGRQPGQVLTREQAANNLQQAATGRVKQAYNERTQLWEATLEKVRSALQQEAKKNLAAVQARRPPAEAAAASAETAAQQTTNQLRILERKLASAVAGDEAAVVDANANVKLAEQLIAEIRSPALPRGAGTSNRGALLTAPERGQSIEQDLIMRETTADRLASRVKPPIAAAPSLEATEAEKAVRSGQTAATIAQKKAQAARNTVASVDADIAKARQGVELVTSVHPNAVGAAIRNLRGKAEQFPNTELARRLNMIADNMVTQDGVVTDPAALNRVLQEAGQKLKDLNLATSGLDKFGVGIISGEIQRTRSLLGKSFTPIKEANKAFTQFTEEVINPLKQGPVGQVAGKGYSPEMQAGLTKFESLMQQGVDATAKVSPIRELGSQLQKADPDAFQDALKTYLSRQIRKAIDPGHDAATTATNPNMAERITANLWNNELQAQALRDAVSVVAKNNKVSPQDAVKGLNNFMQMVRAARNTSGIGGLSPRDVELLGGSSKLADSMRVFSFLPANQAARRVELAVLGKTLREFDTVLTSPEGADLLIKLAKVPPKSRAAMMLVANFGAQAEGAGEAQAKTGQQ